MLAGSDLLVIMVIALVIFGGNRIAYLGACLGKGIRTFKEGLQEKIPRPPQRDQRPHRKRAKSRSRIRGEGRLISEALEFRIFEKVW
ncbi:MAG TPA: twin-arginine translocase TatA/TatE family subunit [Thermodesulfobacteriota bacterium]|nr:twin-arginine translocase TatA/TatE family subunit [Thermodesulfobacteriota bacterium]